MLIPFLYVDWTTKLNALRTRNIISISWPFFNYFFVALLWSLTISSWMFCIFNVLFVKMWMKFNFFRIAQKCFKWYSKRQLFTFPVFDVSYMYVDKSILELRFSNLVSRRCISARHLSIPSSPLSWKSIAHTVYRLHTYYVMDPRPVPHWRLKALFKLKRVAPPRHLWEFQYAKNVVLLI